MKILDSIRKFPSGLMSVPMLLAAVINTFFPQILQIGGITTAVFTVKGTMVCVGILLFITGAQFRVREIAMTLKRGGVICLGRIIIGFAVAFVVMRVFGLEGFWGISSMAFCICIVSTNPGIYIGLIEQYGDSIDRAAFGLLCVISVPTIPVLVMDVTSGMGVDYISIISTLAPFCIGMLLGNLDEKIRQLMVPAMPAILPFLGFCFGSSINLYTAVESGLSGLLLSALYLLINIPLMVLLDRKILHRPGYMATATCSVAAVAVVVPMMLVENNPAYQSYVDSAVAQLAMAIVITSFITPLIMRKFKAGHLPTTQA